MRRALPLTVFFLSWCLGAGAVRAQAGSDLNEVLRLLALRQHGRVEFVEQQFLAVLKQPIESSGELRYMTPRTGWRNAR